MRYIPLSHDQQGQQYAQRSQPQACAHRPPDASQIGAQAGRKDQQGQADPMDGFHVQRAHVMKARHAATHDQAKQQDGRCAGQAQAFRQPIHGQGRQVDHPQDKKEPMGQESAIQMGVGGLESHGQKGQHHGWFRLAHGP